MLKKIGTAILLVFSSGWSVLDILGRMEVLFSLDTKMGHAQHFVLAQSMTADAVAIVIMVASLSFLATLQWPGLWRSIWRLVRRHENHLTFVQHWFGRWPLDEQADPNGRVSLKALYAMLWGGGLKSEVQHLASSKVPRCRTELRTDNFKLKSA